MNNQIHILAPKARRINSYHKKSDFISNASNDYAYTSNLLFSKRKSCQNRSKVKNSKISLDFLRFDFEENVDKLDVLLEVNQIISNPENVNVPIEISRCENPFNKNFKDESLNSLSLNPKLLDKEWEVDDDRIVNEAEISYYSYVKTMRVLFDQYEKKDKTNKSLLISKLNPVFHLSYDSENSTLLKRISFKEEKRGGNKVINTVNKTVK